MFTSFSDAAKPLVLKVSCFQPSLPCFKLVGLSVHKIMGVHTDINMLLDDI